MQGYQDKSNERLRRSLADSLNKNYSQANINEVSPVRFKQPVTSKNLRSSTKERRMSQENATFRIDEPNKLIND